jgi:hypothetical protein
MERLANVLRDALAWLADFGLATLVAFGVCGMFAFTWWMFRDVCRRYSRKFVVIALPVCIAAAIFADKRSGTGTTGDPPVGDGGGSAAMQGEAMSPLPEDEGITNLCFTAISCYTNTLEENVISLDLAWPENFFDAGTTIDILSTTSLVDSAWGWLQSHVVSANETNWTMTVVATNGSCFYKTVVRDSLDDMDDPDGDGLPNVYEAAHGRNPWVDDYAAVQKLTVGPNGWFADVEDAIAASVPYSVIELDPSVMHEATNHTGMAIPQHPVMVTAPYSYAVIHATGISAFMLATNTTSRTIFRNLYVLLDAKPPRDSFQVGFWCGGNLPWSGVPASATFENIYLRMPNPGVQYRGWLFYRSSADPAMLLGCTLNAAGSTWALGIDAYGSPPLGIDGCSFIHFPPDGATGVGCGVRLRASASSDEGTDVAISRTLFDESFTNAWPIVRSDSTSPYFVTVSNCISPRAFPDVYLPDATGDVVVADAALTWSGIPYANSPSVPLGIGSLMPIADDQSVDSDGDGISDYEEVYDRNLDPFLADTDNDGVDDRDEIDDETDPTDPYSFKQTLVVSITNKVSLSYPIRVAWGYSEAGWETNGLAVFPAGHGSTSYTNASSQGATHVKAFCDLNDDGEYDAAHDILLVRPIPYGSTAQINFVFGDVDGDGVSDSQERMDGTDPYDGKNFQMTARLEFTDVDVGYGCTNHVAISMTEGGWNPSEVIVIFAGSSFWYDVATNVMQGVLFVKCLHDRNGDGLYDPDTERIRTIRLVKSSDVGHPVTVSLGDYDGDGICDSQELVDGTGPFDSKSFRMKARIDIVNNDDDIGVTNYVAVSQLTNNWNSSVIVTSFVGYAATYALDWLLTNGAVEVRCLRDFNKDGDFDPTSDILYRRSIGAYYNGKRYHLAIGDYDDDGILDSDEEAEGSDPIGATNYCFNLVATISSIFTPSNGLTVIAYLGVESNVLYGPTNQTGDSVTVDLGHLNTASREKVSFMFWEDLNGNGFRDADERRTVCTIPIEGHDMCVTNSVGLGDFDSDGDGMLDDWEVANGLSPFNAGDAVQDADGDGFCNLHEYWAGTDPADPLENGNGTALLSGGTSVDSRIAGKSPSAATSYFIGFTQNARATITNVYEANFALNENCWMYGVDLSCMSIWNDNSPWEWAEPFTLISPQHVMTASHVTPPNGTRVVFRSFAGDTYVRTLVDTKQILGVAEDDLCVGILDEPLPSDIKIARFLPKGYSSYIGNGRKLPYVRIGREKECAIEDLIFLAPTSELSRMIKIERSTNPTRNLYQRPPVAMDSGHPIFLLFDNELAFLCPTRGYYKSEPGATGFLCTKFIRLTQETMDFLSDTTGRSRCPVQMYDLSSFQHLDKSRTGGLE